MTTSITAPPASDDQPGDDAWFDRLVKEYWGQVYPVALGVSHDPHVATQATSDAFLEFARAVGQRRQINNVRSWLRIRARARAIDQIRRAPPPSVSIEQTVEVDDEPLSDRLPDQRAQQPEDALQARELREFVDGIANRLTPAERSVLPYLLDGWSQAEIARVLELEVDAAKRRVQRLRKKLGDNVRREWLGIKDTQQPQADQQTDEDQTSTDKEGDRNA